MKLFISWSGEFSRKVAECLSVWIPTIIQTVEVFYSPDDIAKGENWGNRLSEELEQSNFGIVCLTPENVLAPWIHFEAGRCLRLQIPGYLLSCSGSTHPMSKARLPGFKIPRLTAMIFTVCSNP